MISGKKLLKNHPSLHKERGGGGVEGTYESGAE